MPSSQQQQQQEQKLEATDYLLPSQYSLRIGRGQKHYGMSFVSDGTLGKEEGTTNNNILSKSETRYLIYRPPFEAAQGIGNLMNGLLAAHMLGEEFNRIVCVSDEWQEFLIAFDVTTQECNAFFMNKRYDNDHYHNSNNDMLWIINFGQLPINECKLRDQLQSKDKRVLYLVANTYPRWPTSNKYNFNKTQSLYRYYKPRKELLNLLPWKEESTNPKQQRAQEQQTPTVVVHLRQPDDVKLDPRNGLDDKTLQLLGEMLPHNTYLVTNQVDYYTYFNTNFGWSHPSWDIVTHSAKMDVIWTTTTTSSSLGNESKPTTSAALTRSTQQQQQHDHERQILQVWSDWLTLHSATVVYHTSSDFSMSAIHWSGISESYTIQGSTTKSHAVENDDMKNGRGKQQRELILKPDHGELSRPTTTTTTSTSTSDTLPLSKRSLHNLQNCNLQPSGLDGLGYVLNLDDEYHDDELEDDWDVQKHRQQQHHQQRR